MPNLRKLNHHHHLQPVGPKSIKYDSNLRFENSISMEHPFEARH